MSFAVQTLAKSAKALPVMLWSLMLGHRRHKPQVGRHGAHPSHLVAFRPLPEARLRCCSLEAPWHAPWLRPRPAALGLPTPGACVG